MATVRATRSALVSGVLASFAVLAAIAGLAATACERRPVGGRVDPGAAVARVNGRPLYQREFERILPEDYKTTLTAAERRRYLDRWIQTEVIFDAAVERELDQAPEIRIQLEQYRKDLVADRLVQEVIEKGAVVTDDEVRAYYRAHEDEYTRELRVSHILVNTLEQAAKVRELLNRRTFSWVARRHSIDKHTGPGGDLGFLSKGNMVPEFEHVVFKMKVGEISDIVETEFGYHFLKVTDERDARNKLSYEDAAEQISRVLMLKKRSEVYDSLMSTLVSRAGIEILDEELAAAGAREGADTAVVENKP